MSAAPKYDHLKAMKNTHLNNNTSSRRKEKRDHFSIGVTIPPADQVALKKFFNYELAYYNSITSALNSRLYAFPQTLLEISDGWSKIFELLATHPIDLVKLRNATPDFKLDAVYTPYKKLLLEKDETGKRYFNDRFETIMSLPLSAGNIYSTVRTAIAAELLAYYKEQANRFLKSSKNSTVPTMELVQPADIINKRHLQIPRSACLTKYDEEKNSTLIKTPYTRETIVLPETNVDERIDWNLMIIHQQPEVMPASTTPWTIDFYNCNEKYKIKYRDMLKFSSIRNFS